MDAQPLFTFTDPDLPEAATSRLGGQNGRILARLRQGPASNVELERVSGSRRVNSRIADVRRWLVVNEGRTVACESVDVARGLYRYWIV